MAECCRHFPELVLRFMDTYRRVPGGPADRRIDLCPLHFRDWLEDEKPVMPTGGRVPNPRASTVRVRQTAAADDVVRSR